MGTRGTLAWKPEPLWMADLGERVLRPGQRCAASKPGLGCQAAASWKVTSRWSPRWAGVFYEILRAEVDYVPGMRGLCQSPRGPLL